MKSAINYLQQKSLKSWQITSTRKKKHEVYAENGIIDSFRCSESTHYSVSVHTKATVEDTIGESHAQFEAAPGVAHKLIDDITEMAGLVQNPEYEFSPAWQPADQTNYALDQKIQKYGSQILEETASDLINLKSKDLSGCSLVSFELFFIEYYTRKQNARGLDLFQPTTRVLWDFVLMTDNKEFETNQLQQRRMVSQLPFTDILKKEATLLNDLKTAVLPTTGKHRVVLAEEALDTIFNYFVTQAGGAALFDEYSNLRLNAPVLSDHPYETLNLSSSPMLPGGEHSLLFDNEGYPVLPLKIIEAGILKNYAISGKYAGLLKRDPTSTFANIIVEPGMVNYQDFLEDGVYELLRFSTFEPDPVTGAFSGEIRSGYLHKAGKKIPIRGGSVSGIIQQAFSKARFSAEAVQRSGYKGPKGIWFEELTIAGD